jgi:hypothetical protein
LAPNGLILPSSFQVAQKMPSKHHWNAKIKWKDLCHKHKIKTTMIMDDGSETSDQCCHYPFYVKPWSFIVGLLTKCNEHHYFIGIYLNQFFWK